MSTVGTTRICATASTAASVVNRSKICCENRIIASEHTPETISPHTSTVRRMTGTRSYLRAPRFWPTMLLPAVVKELDTMPIIMFTLL